MQFSTSLAITLAAYVAAQGVGPTGNRNTSFIAWTESSANMSLVTVVLPPVTYTAPSYITYCPSPTVFAVGNISYTVTTATYVTVVCQPNVACPVIQRPVATPTAPFSNSTAPYQNFAVPTSVPGTCPSGVTCPLGNSASASGQGQSANAQAQSANGQVLSATGAGALTNGLASAGTHMGSMSNTGASDNSSAGSGANGGASTSNNSGASGNSSPGSGANGGASTLIKAGASGASGASATGRVLSSDASKFGASIVALIVVVATAIGL
jgi:hypothetical protein